MKLRFRGSAILETESGEFTVHDEKSIYFTPTETLVLQYLMSRKKGMYTANDVLNHVWESGKSIITARHYLKAIRWKLDAKKSSFTIQNNCGFGYALVPRKGAEYDLGDIDWKRLERFMSKENKR